MKEFAKESELREFSETWLHNILISKNYKIVLSPMVFHGKGEIYNFLLRDKKDVYNILANFYPIREMKRWIVEPDVIAIIEKEEFPLWIVLECKFPQVGIRDVGQLFMYAQIMNAYAAGLTYYSHVSSTVERLMKVKGNVFYGREGKARILKFLGMYYFDKIKETFIRKHPEIDII